MLNFSTLLLRSYYAAIGWNEDNLYSNITRSSSALLDFAIPDSLVLQLAKAPTGVFFTSYGLDALPQLNGSVSYITTSVPVAAVRVAPELSCPHAEWQLGPSTGVRFRDVVEHFRVHAPPRKPLPKDEIWQGGRRVEGRDYLLYSRMHFPTLQMTGLATTRLTPTTQAHVAFVSQPTPSRPLSAPQPAAAPSHVRQPSSDAPHPPPSPPPLLPSGNVHLSLTHDTGRYAGEYTYSAADGMVGLRGLWNFGWTGGAALAALDAAGSPRTGSRDAESSSSSPRTTASGKRIDEEEMMDGGLRGRFSAGGEVYFSAKQRSFGISTGVRFTTIPPVLPLGPHAPAPSPPTTLTLLYNPLIGFLSTSYAAQVSPTVALASRFGVNVYSYESDLAIGGEWWVGRRRGKRDADADAGGNMTAATAGSLGASEDDGGRQRYTGQRVSLRGLDADGEGPVQAAAAPRRPAPVDAARDDERDGVIKARLSGNWSIALLYESRIRNCLVSIGVISDLLSRQKPIRALGLEVQYFS